MDPSVIKTEEEAPPINTSDVPPYMLRKSSKKILNKTPEMQKMSIKKLRMKSLLWIKPSSTMSFVGGNGANVNGSSTKQSSTTTSLTSIWSQLFPTIIMNLAVLSSGMSLGYSAIVIPQLKSASMYNLNTTDHYMPFIINDSEGSWIASMFGLGAVFGGFSAAYLGSHYGARLSIMILSIPDLIGWIFIASSQNVTWMLLGRFLNGYSAAGYSPLIQIFIAEIAQPQHRGWLSGIMIPTLGFGTLLSYIGGYFLPWHYVAAIAALIPGFLIPGLFWLSDSPYWYLQQGQDKKALVAIERFRGQNSNGIAELLNISDTLNTDSMEFSLKDSLSHLTRRQYRRPFLILNFLFLLMVFSGNYAITFYSVEIFQKWHSSLNEFWASIIVGLIKFLSSLLIIPALRFFSRRFLLCTSSILMGISLAILGLANLSHDTALDGGIMGNYYLIPLASIIVYMMADPVGLGSIPYLYTAEFFPSEMRSILSGITIGLTNLELFIVVKTFPDLSSMMGGSHGAFWLYASVCFMAAIYVLLFIPETKEKSLQDIESYFGRKESLHVTPFSTPKTTKKGLSTYPELSLQFTL